MMMMMMMIIIIIIIVIIINYNFIKLQSIFRCGIHFFGLCKLYLSCDIKKI